MKNSLFYRIYGQLANFGFQVSDEIVDALLRIRRLERKNQRLAEYDCNGEGYVRGKFYRCYGSTPDAYINVEDGTTIFMAESDKVQDRIQAIAKAVGLTVEFQGDPRGYTVRISINNRDISHIIFE